MGIGRGFDHVWPSAQQARDVVIFFRGAEDFPHGPVDWLAVNRLGAPLVRMPDPDVWPPGPPPRAKRAVDARRAMVTGDRPMYADEPVSFETLGAVYYILTLGQYTKDCPNFLSPQGRHRWRFTPPHTGDEPSRVCDFCGDQRQLSEAASG
jgi:hypothetical protein